MAERKSYLEIAERLRRVREHFSNMTRKDWATKHGFNPTQYTNWEGGLRRIPIESAEKLCDTYSLSLDYIYRGKRDGLSEGARDFL